MTEKGLIQLLLKQFLDEETATEYLVEKRWGDKITCPHCDGDKVNRISGTQPFKCSPCNKKFSVKTGTFMHNSHMSIRVWLVVMFFMSKSKQGITSVDLAEYIGVRQGTVWSMCQRIRTACEQRYGILKGIVEADETYFGGKERNKHRSQRVYQGRGVANKIAVIGIKERDGKVIAKVVDNTKKETLQNYIATNVSKNSAVITDEHKSYTGLNKLGYQHHTVNHSKGEYVDGVAHTNSIESFWALLKNTIYGTHNYVRNQYLQSYINEITFKRNTTDYIGDICGNLTLNKG